MQVFETYISRLGPVGPRKFYVSLQVFHCCHRAFKALEINAKFIAFNILCLFIVSTARRRREKFWIRGSVSADSNKKTCSFDTNALNFGRLRR